MHDKFNSLIKSKTRFNLIKIKSLIAVRCILTGLPHCRIQLVKHGGLSHQGHSQIQREMTQNKIYLNL